MSLRADRILAAVRGRDWGRQELAEQALLPHFADKEPEAPTLLIGRMGT